MFIHRSDRPTARSRVRSVATAVLLVSLLAGSCGDADDGAVDDGATEDDTTDVDPVPTRDDVDCEAAAAEDDFVSLRFVVDGVLGEVCAGEEDQRLVDAWDALSVVAPTLALADLGLFGGFAGPDGDAEEVTLAYVNTLDDDGTLFQMSVNLDSFESDPNESYLTMAHEFSHVFTQLPSQLDRSPEARDACDTYDNGEGCFLPDSLMAQWIDWFWPEDLLGELDPDNEATVAAGEELCSVQGDFFGPYAASNPEEDFAETFSAYVFGLDYPDDLADKMAWMDAQPGLAEFRDRAAAAGLSGLDNNFETCG